MFENGTIIDGKYEILSKIGQGGMSVIYLAINRKANKQWAIKEVRKDGVKDFEIVKQGLVAETEILKKLNHENLPSIVDIIETQGTFLIIMDYIEGTTLESILKEYGAQPQEDVIIWAKQLCDVLLYLHTRNPKIIYRDMKPSNIMLKPDGTIVLIDFGTAREFKAQNLADTTCLGTQGYAAPEQFGGQGQTDERTDIYCLGATIYHLVTGHNPCEPPYTLYPIRQWNPGLSSGLEDIIIKCTQKNPDDRYQSTAELLYALDNYQVIDYNYQKKQKMKLVAFLASVALSVVFALTGLFASYFAAKNQGTSYQDILQAAASLTPGTQNWLNKYQEAVMVKPEDPKAYLSFIEDMEQDKEITSAEMGHIYLVFTTENLNAVKKDKINNYREVCYKLGQSIYLNYERPSKGGVLSSKKWFVKAIEGIEPDDSSFTYKTRSDLYLNTIVFWGVDIQNLAEKSEKDLIKTEWDSAVLKIGIIGDETESMKLMLYSVLLDGIFNNIGNFKFGEVTFSEMEQVYITITSSISLIDPTLDKDIELKRESVSKFELLKKRIESFYPGNIIGE